MSEEKKMNKIGALLIEMLKQQGISMRKLSELSGIDTATISRIINGKRKAKPEHLQRFSECLGIPVIDLFVATGFPIEQKKEALQSDDIAMSMGSIQNILEASSINIKNFNIGNIEQQIDTYEQFANTKEGKETVLKGFEEKLQKVGSIGPFINYLKDMFVKFTARNGSPRELALMGAALLYFILPVDVIPDYIFPIGYVDDAIAVKLVIDLLSRAE